MSRPVILIVEDEPVTLMTLAEILRQAGYSVLSESSHTGALNAFRAGPVNAVLMDYTLSETGASLGLQLKKINAAVPILVLSGNPAAGKSCTYADDLIAKPEHPEILLQRLDKALRNALRRGPPAAA